MNPLTSGGYRDFPGYVMGPSVHDKRATDRMAKRQKSLATGTSLALAGEPGR
jgi:hypothetical protein